MSIFVALEGIVRFQLPTEYAAKTLIGLGGCPGCSVRDGCPFDFVDFVTPRLIQHARPCNSGQLKLNLT